MTDDSPIVNPDDHYPNCCCRECVERKQQEEDRRPEHPIVEQDDDEDYLIIRWVCYHAVARCRDCDFEDQDWRTAQQSASEHCDKTGHKMSLETGYLTNDGYLWDGNKPDYGEE